jgi:DNA-binding response OmpR family regulator
LKVLVADNDPHLLALYCQVLNKSGFVVQSAVDGNDAVSKFIHERPEIVMLDNGMPGRSGLEAARDILQMRPSTQVIMLTGDSKVLPEAEALGVDIFLAKPISVKKLIESVTALANSRPLRQIVAR